MSGLRDFYAATSRTHIKRRFVPGEGVRFFVRADGSEIGSASSRTRAERIRKQWARSEAGKLAALRTTGADSER